MAVFLALLLHGQPLFFRILKLNIGTEHVLPVHRVITFPLLVESQDGTALSCSRLDCIPVYVLDRGLFEHLGRLLTHLLRQSSWHAFGKILVRLSNLRSNGIRLGLKDLELSESIIKMLVFPDIASSA